MNLSEPFIRRPVMTTLVMLSLFFFGIVSYKSLPVSDLPNVDFPTLEVSVSNPGANPETMANAVSIPLERQFMTIEGLETIISQNLTGQTIILLQFALDKKLETAAVDVQAAITASLPNLPQNLPFNPIYQKINPSQSPIIYYAMTSPSMDLATLNEYAYTFIGKRLSMLRGVSQVITFGSSYAARIQVDPEKLAAKGIGIDEVVSAVQEGNVDFPLGSLYGPKREFTIKANGRLTNAEGYNALVLKAQDGSLVRISDIGNAIDSLQDDKYTLKFYNQEKEAKCVLLAVQTQPGANAMKVTEEIDAIFPQIQKELPPSISYYNVFRKSEMIKESVKDVKITLLVAFNLVVLIIYFSLVKSLNTIIPSLAIPMSIKVTFIIL